ncbi:MAG: BON domain-containing protein [Candidatus Sulfotelmatobacter sp.]|jgi:hyperosmotically inducible protein
MKSPFNLTLRPSILTLLFACLLSAGCMVASAQDSSQQTAPDNTKLNQRDQDKSQPTADQQKDNRSDRDITQQIRQSVTKDKSLSTYAHNVKIISQNGMVTLKGPVRSDEEKRAIETKAADIVGQDKVTSELQVVPQK